MDSEGKIAELKRKLSEDRVRAYNKRLEKEKEKKELKRLRERKRYYDKKQISNESSKIIPGEPSSQTKNNTKLVANKKRSHLVTKMKKNVKSEKEKRDYEREKKRKQREKIYSDPELHKKFLLKSQRDYQVKKERGSVKSISAMTDKEKNIQRSKWRNNKRNFREKSKNSQSTEEEIVAVDGSVVVDGSDSADGFSAAESTKSSRNSGRTVGKNISKVSVKRQTKKIVALEEENRQLIREQVNLKQKSDRYKKRLQRERTITRSPSPNREADRVMSEGPGEVRKQLSFSFALQKQIKENYNAASSQEKTAISRTVAGPAMKKYKQLGNLKKLVSLKRYTHHKNKRGIFVKRQQRNVLQKCLLKKVISDFFHDDEITVQSPNKKDFKTFKRKKRLKRYMTDTLPNLHKKFMKLTNKKLSYNNFASYKPFYVVHLRCNARDTCACVKHLNAQLKLDKLKEHKIVELRNLHEVMKNTTCDSQRLEKCMLGLCKKCEVKQLQTLDYDKNTESFYYQWLRCDEERINKKGEKYSFKAMTKQKVSKTLEQIVSDMHDSIPDFLIHQLNISNQHEYLRGIKQNLDSTSVILNCDFSENYATKYNTEIQALHYGGSRMLLTLHTCVYYILDGTEVKCQKFCSVSNDVRHTASAVFAHIKPLLAKFKEMGITNLNIFTDGPTGQYKNKSAFFLLFKFAKEYGFSTAVWNFWETGHGKGPSDGIGAALKSKADNKVAHGDDIVDVKSFIDVVGDGNIELIEITTEDVDEVEKILPKESKAAVGTLKIHQVIWKSENKTLYLRKRSCLHVEDFSPCTLCDLEKPKYDPFEKPKVKSKSKPSAKEKSESKPLAKEKSKSKPAISETKKGKKETQINSWVAISEEDSNWYIAKVHGVKDVAGKVVVIIDSVLISTESNPKRFGYDKDPNHLKEIFDDDIICTISEPTKLKKNNLFSIKNYNKVLKSISQI